MNFGKDQQESLQDLQMIIDDNEQSTNITSQKVSQSMPQNKKHQQVTQDKNQSQTIRKPPHIDQRLASTTQKLPFPSREGRRYEGFFQNPMPPKHYFSTIKLYQTLRLTDQVYRVHWYNKELDITHEVSFQADGDMTIDEFIQLTINKFNHQFSNECLTSFFIENTQTTYQLFMSKKSGKPNEDFPCNYLTFLYQQKLQSAFEGKQILKKTMIHSFALKVTRQKFPDLMLSQTLSDEEEKKQIKDTHYDLYSQYKVNPGISPENSDIGGQQIVNNSALNKKKSQQQYSCFMCCFVDNE